MSKSDQLAENAAFFAEMERAAKKAIEEKIKVIKEAIQVFEEKGETAPSQLQEKLYQAEKELEKFDLKH